MTIQTFMLGATVTRKENIHALTYPMSAAFARFTIEKGGYIRVLSSGEQVFTATGGTYIKSADFSDGSLNSHCRGMGKQFCTETELNVTWPAWVAENPSAAISIPAIVIQRVGLGGSDWVERNGYATTTRAQLFAWVKARYTLIRPGNSGISPEWLNRICHNTMNRVTGRTLDFRPPYFSQAGQMVTIEYAYDDAVQPYRYTSKAMSNNFLFDGTEIDAIDPWAKMFKGIEHQVFHYGEGDTVAPNAGGQYKWPFGLTMPIPPTVGNIYVHFLQMYLAQLARDIGQSALSSLVWSAATTSVSFATVYPESVNSAQVAIGNYIIYTGYGITYGHPEGAYIARLMMTDATLSDPQVLAMARDVAAYANRRRVAWINQNQAIHAKAQQIAAAGGDLYALNISELTAVNIVVTDAGGTVVSTGAATEITGGSGSGAIVTETPATGQELQVTDVTPTGANPLQIGTVKVTAGAATVPAGSGGSTLAPIVSIARDTSPALVTAQRAYAAAKSAGATDAQASEAAQAAVTTPEKKGSLVPIGALLAILSLIN